MAEILRDHAYSTLAAGKWHLTPLAEATAAGPFEAWPLGRGFDRWYGFHGAMTDEWHPELFEDNHPIDAPDRRGYHLSEDLVDRAIAFVRDQQSARPERPFFLYLAFGACHWAHQVPRPFIEKYRGRYDRGWDVARAERLGRQKRLGVVPPNTELAPRNPGVEAWSGLSPDKRRVCARLQEVYAAFLEHTDAQIGRLLAFLDGLGRTSLAYTFDSADAPTRKQTQHYELLGDRALWHRGWKAVTRHEKGADFEADRWELYHVDEDFSECRDLADTHPDRLRELVERWWAEAGVFAVLPLDDREYERVFERIRALARTRYVYYPGMARIDRSSAPDVTDRSYGITAEVEIPPAGAEGVLLAAGTRFGGYVLYLKDGRLVHEYVYSETVRHTIVSDAPVAAGARRLRYEFTRTGTRQGGGAPYVDERRVGVNEVPKTWPLHGIAGGVFCGRDGAVPVSDAYICPFVFTGTIHRVIVELGDDGRRDAAGEARSALAEE
ncbi:MAG: sulfatase-like hydrolase/transferase [Candidatus Rokuibacteriota bacterium]